MIGLGRWLSLGLIGIACACTAPPPADPDPADVVLAVLGDRTLTLADFQHYLDDNLAGDDETDALVSEGAAVKSRLLDAFIDERLLLLEADRRAVQVTDLEVEAYLKVGGLSDAGRDPSAPGSDWEDAARRLKIEKLHEALVRDLLPLSGEEAPSPAAQWSTAQGGDGRRLRLRSLMLESPDLADRVSRDIRAGRMTFNEAVVAHTATPEEGLPVELRWDSLSEEHRGILRNLKPGQVSQPLSLVGGTYLFQVEAWLREDRRSPEAQAREARLRAERLRVAEASRMLIAHLRDTVPVRLNARSLPFPYVPADGVDPPRWNRVVERPG